MTKVIIAIIGTVLIVAGGLLLVPKKEKEPVVPEVACADGGMSITACAKACVVIVDLNNNRLKDAKRLSEDEAEMLLKDAKENCKYACERVSR